MKLSQMPNHLRDLTVNKELMNIFGKISFDAVPEKSFALRAVIVGKWSPLGETLS